MGQIRQMKRVITMATIKPNLDVLEDVGNLKIKSGADSSGLGAAFNRKKRASSQQKCFLTHSSIFAQSTNRISDKGIRTVGYAKDPQTGIERPIKTIALSVVPGLGSLAELAEKTRIKSLTRSLVGAARPLGNQNKLRAFMSDPEKQSGLRDDLSTLNTAASNDTFLDILEDIPARDVAMVKGLFALASLH